MFSHKAELILMDDKATWLSEWQDQPGGGFREFCFNHGVNMSDLPEMICEAGRIMFDKRLTDMAGGNISARDGEVVYMSPRYSGQRYHWDLKPEQLVSGNWENDEITKDPKFSREGWSHLYIYRNFPEVNAVIHAHPFHIMPFAAFCRPIEPVLEGTRKFGIVDLCDPAEGHTKKLAENILTAMQGKQERMRIQAAAVLIPYHGIILAGHDFEKTLDALERIDENAFCLITRKFVE
jgi:L-fuculose-phosphate aldolase